MKIGDFVLIKFPCYGIGYEADIGPWVVQVKSLDVDGFGFNHYSNVNGANRGYASGTTSYESIVAKIHHRDVEALIKLEVQPMRKNQNE